MAKNKGGRPTKLTPELIEEICSLLRAGSYIETACNFVGVSKDTYYRWAKDGARAKSGIKKHFSDSIKKAIAEAEIRDLNDIRKDGSWQSKAWRLERRFPERWAVKKAKEDNRDVMNKLEEILTGIENA